MEICINSFDNDGATPGLHGGTPTHDGYGDNNGGGEEDNGLAAS